MLRFTSPLSFVNRRHAQLALACAVVFGSSAFAQGAAQGPIKIGLITDKVGPAKPYAEPVAAGAVFAVTLEPEQGLPHAAPSGPVVAKGQILSI